MKRILVYFLLCSHAIFCQNYIYEEFGLNDGLPSNQVYDIYQAKNNVIWFATDRGIASYNGYEFTAYDVNDGLLNNCVLDLYPQENGTVYCTTINNQLFYFNDHFDGFHKYQFSDTLKKYLKHFQKITDVYIDKKNNFYFGCDNLHQEFIINNEGTASEIIDLKPIGAGYSFFINFKKVNENKIFGFATLQGNPIDGYENYFFEKETYLDLNLYPLNELIVYRNMNHISIINYQLKEIKRIDNGKRPLCFTQINENKLFIGYFFGGGKILDIDGNILNSFLNKKSVTRFLIDHEGGYWFTTLYSGVIYIKNPEIKSIFTSDNWPISALSRNKSGELMIGYENGAISKLEENKIEKLIVGLNNEMSADIQYNPLSKNCMYATAGQLSLDFPFKTSHANRYTAKLSEPMNGKVIASNLKSICIFEKVGNSYNSQLLYLPFRSMDACFSDEDIFLVTGEGLHRMRKEKTEFLGHISKYFNYRADDIDFNTSTNELYLATLGAGVVVYDLSTDSIYSIQEKDGLFNNIVNEVYIENENDIWACTNSGLNKIHFKSDGSYQITGIRNTDGLPNDGITDIEIINDTVWIGSKKGLVYAPKSLFESKKNLVDYPIEIRQIRVNDSIVYKDSTLELSYEQNRIDFFIETASQKYGSKVNYKYRLVGLEKDYHISKYREINYSSLPPDKYIFTVQSINEDGEVLSDTLDFPFTINPPYWKTWWFRLLITLGVLGIIYLFFKLRILSYNKSISGEILRMILKRLKRKERYFTFKDGTREKRIKSNTITFIKSDGNYLRVYTDDKNFLIRCKIGDFIELTPDPKEFLRVHRSYIIRIDKVDSKGKQEIIIKGQKIPVSGTYEKELEKLIF